MAATQKSDDMMLYMQREHQQPHQRLLQLNSLHGRSTGMQGANEDLLRDKIYASPPNATSKSKVSRSNDF